jgi:hypothetical protein
VAEWVGDSTETPAVLVAEISVAPAPTACRMRWSGANSRDIDDTAHAVLTAFEELYCGERRGTVVRYRVYRRVGENPGVRVQVMTDERLRQLDAGIEAARAVVIRLGGRGILDR